MMIQTLILISYLAIISALSHLMRKWSIGILLILPVPIIVQLTANARCFWILTVLTLTILDIRRMREKSVFIKYNPMAEGCKLPKADGSLRGSSLRGSPHWWGESGGVSVFVIYYSHEKVT